MIEKWISREDESKIPRFDNYHDAKAYFEEKYGKDFILQSFEDDIGPDGVRCYFHALVFDWEAYHALTNYLMQGDGQSGNGLIGCYQPIQIFEDGHIHIVH